MPTIDATPLPQGLAPDDTGHIDHHDQLHAAFDTEIFANEVNVMHPDYGADDGGDDGINTDAINLAVADIVATGKPGLVIIPLGVDLPVIPDEIEGATDVFFDGGGTLSTTQTTPGSLIKFPDGSARCGVRNLRFVSPNNEIVAVESVHNDDVTVTKSLAIGARLWVGGTGLYADNDETNATTNAKITDNIAVATVLVNTASCIWAYYVRGAIIDRNIVIGHVHGIGGWGGDADPAVDGDLANERKCNSLTLTSNIVMDSAGAGIWFSMCEGVVLTACVATGCGDVGFDFEGCVDGSAGTCTARDNIGGNFTTFFHGRGILFEGCTGSWSVPGVMARCANYTTLPLQMDVKFLGCTFRGAGGISLISVEPTAVFTFERNILTNTRIDTKFNNQGDTIVEHNTFLFTESMSALGAADRYAIKVGQNHDNPRISICGNRIRTTVGQPAGARAIDVEMDDPITFPVVTIDHNDTPGWGALPIRTVHSGSNAGCWALWHIGWNNLGEGTGIDRVETGAAKSVMLREGNKQHGVIPVPRTIPVAGYWDIDEEATLVPTAGGWRKAVCVTAGEPGTWRNWGAISA